MTMTVAAEPHDADRPSREGRDAPPAFERSISPIAGRLGSGSEVAAACVYLASDEAAYMTGQTLHVNGGMAMI